MTRVAADVANDVANVLMPSDCRVCGAAMVVLARVGVCEACVRRVGTRAEAERDVLCTRCGDAVGMESARFAAAMGVSECTLCRLAPPRFDRAVSFGPYEDEMRRMLHLLKFEGMRGVAEHALGEAMADAARRLRGDAADELVVVPVPLFAARERKRGFNQARLLAEAAVRRLRRVEPGWRLRLSFGVLERVKNTQALYALNPAERRASLRDAFRVGDAEAVRGREVLLIDDIMTTGATARECARVLKLAGAAKVWVVTAARALPESGQSVARHEAGADAGRQDANGFVASDVAASDVAMWDAVPARVVEPEVGRRVRF